MYYYGAHWGHQACDEGMFIIIDDGGWATKWTEGIILSVVLYIRNK